MQAFTAIVMLALAGVSSALQVENGVTQSQIDAWHSLSRNLADETSVPDYVTSCLSQYSGLNAYLNCEQEYAAEILNSTGGSALTAVMTIGSTVTDVSSLTEAQCYSLFNTTVYPDLTCAWYIQGDSLTSFLQDMIANFTGVSQCTEMGTITTAAIYGGNMTAIAEQYGEECTESSSQDSMGTSAARRELQTSEDSTSTISSSLSSVTTIVNQFNTVSNKCKEIAPDSVAVAPSPANINIPSFAILLMAVFLSLWH